PPPASWMRAQASVQSAAGEAGRPVNQGASSSSMSARTAPPPIVGVQLKPWPTTPSLQRASTGSTVIVVTSAAHGRVSGTATRPTRMPSIVGSLMVAPLPWPPSCRDDAAAALEDHGEPVELRGARVDERRPHRADRGAREPQSRLDERHREARGLVAQRHERPVEAVEQPVLQLEVVGV